MYKKLPNHPISGADSQLIERLSDNAFIPFDQANTDYQNFKKQINADEAQLEDADGNVMTAEQAQAFVKELP